jgi:phenylpyruvate tautomerase PptA (4-oxalocrotonate tautomerase family)
VFAVTIAALEFEKPIAALDARIAELLHAGAGIPRADVVVNLVETKRENWSFGNGEAPFA